MNAKFEEAQSIYRQPGVDEQYVIDLLNDAIGEGCIDAYPMKALLSASNDWDTLRICRLTQFQLILREGIDLGCLAPEHRDAWRWFCLACDNNDPTPFIDDDMEQYYDLLMTALEHGLDVRYIIDYIWEPEQEIEED